mmetsp:Transcript_9572/g.58317  ORF Transcript_9572/g.58317 Transcript_9572/m.58317 type:complete len:226 (+) Transcript_9572:1987-2664(+)
MYFPTYNQRMQWGAHVNFQELTHSPCHNLLIPLPHPGHANAHDVLSAGPFLPGFFYFEHLLNGILDAHIPWRFVFFFPATQGLHGKFLDPYVQQAECVQSSFPVRLQLVIEAVWFPGFGEEDQGYTLSIPIQLQSTDSHTSEYVCIVHHTHFHTSLSSSKLQVTVGGRTEGISHHEERHVFGLRAGQKVFVYTLFGEFSIRHFDFHAVCRFQFLHARRQDAGVCF